jgi:hypothetical protein
METFISWTLANVVVPVMAMVVLALVGRLVNTLNTKYHLGIQHDVVVNAVHYAEQIAQTAIKNNQGAVSGPEKKALAISYVNQVLPGQNQSVVATKIESQVQQIVPIPCENLGKGK